jgi:hypothetical protein
MYERIFLNIKKLTLATPLVIALNCKTGKCHVLRLYGEFVAHASAQSNLTVTLYIVTLLRVWVENWIY